MSRSPIINPILPGFNPDPSTCRVGDDYYIATSTFEWYPGVQIYHSTDLKSWRLVARPLNRPSLLNMLGNPDSCGVWAPCLTYDNGLFYLCYTDVKRFDGNFKDTHNYLTTCETIDGDWSETVYLNSSGFDPSLFHEEDGSKWFVNMVWDHRGGDTFFAGIVLQQYSVQEQQLVGKRKFIFKGTDLDYTEGPHLYKRNGFYYLITAEGGTSYGHAVTMARSRSIDGPYEVDPDGPVVTSRDNSEWPMQRAGHGDIVETQNGELYLVHLASRTLDGRHVSPLGRETAIQKLEFTDDGWFRLASGGSLPELEVDAPDLPESTVPSEIERDEFGERELNPVYQWLRSPWPEEFMSLDERPGHLRLYGMESPGSLFRQALIARRLTSTHYEASTCIEFEPENFQQLAGLIVYYSSRKFHYLYISTDETTGRHLGIMSCDGDMSLRVRYPLQEMPIRLPETEPIRLRAVGQGGELRFSWSLDGSSWAEIPLALDASLLSDENGREDGPNFTGTFVGVCCNDVTGMRKHADFDFFSYCVTDRTAG
jgi:xylan 1,4-beta-xylosidase